VFLSIAKGAKQDAFIKSILDDMETDDEALDLEESETNYSDLLNGLVAKSHLFNYSGSLTTPDCSEIVDWWVLNTPIYISQDDFNRMEALYGELPATNGGSDNRPTQPLNDRELHYFYRRPKVQKECCGGEADPAIVADPF
jgi:carbonic anhydrase